MLRVFAVAGVLLLVAVVVLTSPVRSRPYGSGVSADPSRLLADVEALTGLPGFRCYERPHDLDRAAEWVGSALEKSGLPVEVQSFRFGGRQFSNFLAREGPADADARSSSKRHVGRPRQTLAVVAIQKTLDAEFTRRRPQRIMPVDGVDRDE